MIHTVYRQSPRRRKGVAAVFALVMLVVLIGFASLTLDVGAMYNTRADLQNAADAAAMAGAAALVLVWLRKQKPEGRVKEALDTWAAARDLAIEAPRAEPADRGVAADAIAEQCDRGLDEAPSRAAARSRRR